MTDRTFLFVCEMFKATRHVIKLDMEGNDLRAARSQVAASVTSAGPLQQSLTVNCEDALRFGSTVAREGATQIRILMKILPVRFESIEKDRQTDVKTDRETRRS